MSEQINVHPSSSPISVDKFDSLLKQIQEASKQVRASIYKIPSKISPTDKGLTLLQVKNTCFATYLISLGHLICSKLEGHSIANHSVLNMLVQMRITLEKIKPIESKLKYRIDKLLKTLNQAASSQNDTLSHKPNLAAFQDSSSDEDEAVSNSANVDPSHIVFEEKDRIIRAMEKEKAYRPPKLTAVKYDDGDSKLPPKRFSKNLLRELKEEFSEAPEVKVDAPEILDEAFQERQEFEEAHFTRLNISKKEKRRISKPKSMGNELRSLLENDN